MHARSPLSAISIEQALHKKMHALLKAVCVQVPQERQELRGRLARVVRQGPQVNIAEVHLLKICASSMQVLEGPGVAHVLFDVLFNAGASGMQGGTGLTGQSGLMGTTGAHHLFMPLPFCSFVEITQ